MRAGFVALTVYATAMAFVEAACVISLKRLYFPEGWVAPFHPIPPEALRLEQWREAATLAMIASVACLGRPGFRIALARGLWMFGLWDMLYYAFLRGATGFPSRLTDLDLVFLVPRPWIAPVWVACLGSLLCAVGAQVLSRRGGRHDG
ncbi:MAG TPA: hypothetical protein VE402_05750 [Candidatus Angelobacter sp.]|nr:hypothetical protein [Candidatus Angelobacter sp.]